MDTASTTHETSARPSWPRWLLLAGRLILGAVFVYAGYVKLRQPWMLFAMSIESYQLVSDSLRDFLAQTLPWFELVLGLLLLTGLALRWTATVTAGLLVFFFCVMLHAFLKGMQIDCGCLGPNEKLGPWTLARDGALLTLALAVTTGAFLMHRRKTA
jgi:uncharacterized membrane protein YphA (DoxX/SURF4 family)